MIQPLTPSCVVALLGSGTSSLEAGPSEGLQHLALRGGPQDVTGRFPGLRISRSSDALRRFLKIVGRAPELDVRSEEDPVGARLPVGHPDAPGIHDARASDPPV